MNSVARELRVDNGGYVKWEAGEQRPGLDAALRIERLCGIPVAAWAKDAEIAAEVAAPKKKKAKRSGARRAAA